MRMVKSLWDMTYVNFVLYVQPSLLEEALFHYYFQRNALLLLVINCQDCYAAMKTN